jgi:peptidyl-prolyl cis-trans isomerase SurA
MRCDMPRQKNGPRAFWPGMSLVVLLCVAGHGRLGWAQGGQLIDGLAAVVNDEVITISEVREAMAIEDSRLQQQYSGSALQEQRSSLYGKVLQDLIDVRIQLARARELNLQVDEDDVTYHIDRLKQQNQLSDAQLEQMLKSRGLTIEAYRQQVREGLLVAKVVNAEVRSRLVVTEDEIRDEYKKRRERYSVPGKLTVSHILFLLPPEASPEEEAQVRQKATKVLQALRHGKDFAELARQYSEGPSAERGGLLGTFRVGELLPGFEEAAQNLAPGEISDLVRTRAGFHIIRVEDRQKGGYRDLEEVREEIKADLLQAKTERRYDEWLETLRQSAYVKIHYQG